jgi:hypothetical protein
MNTFSVVANLTAVKDPSLNLTVSSKPFSVNARSTYTTSITVNAINPTELAVLAIGFNATGNNITFTNF